MGSTKKNVEIEMKKNTLLFLAMSVSLLILPLVLYARALNGGFIWDDWDRVVYGPLMHIPEGLLKFWTTKEIPDAWPLTYSIMWFEWHLWGMNPLGYHVINCLLHGLNAFLIWRLLHRIGLRWAWGGALLFCAHPVNVEAVAWIFQLKTALCATLGFAALVVFWDYSARPDRGSLYWLSLGLFAASLLAKTATVTFPLVILGILWWRSKRLTRQDLERVFPFFLVASFIGVINIWWYATPAVSAGNNSATVLFAARVVTAGFDLWFYLGKALWPHPLMFVYPAWTFDPHKIGAAIPALLVLGISGLLWWRRKTPWGGLLLGAWGYYLVVLLPVLGFFDIYFMRYSPVADHWQYVAIPAVLAVLSEGICRALARFHQLAPKVGIALLASVLGILTIQEAGYYASDEVLLKETTRRNPKAWLAYSILGVVVHRQGRSDEAIASYRKSLEIHPDNPYALTNLGIALEEKGQMAEAEPLYRKAIQSDPTHATACMQLGNLLFRRGAQTEGLDFLKKAVELSPRLSKAQASLAAALQVAGQNEKAMEHYARAIALEPRLAEAHNNLGLLFEEQGRFEEARFHYETALQAKPGFVLAQQNLNNLLAKLQRKPRCLRQQPPQPLVGRSQGANVSNAAAEYFERGNLLSGQGRILEAISSFDEALKLNPSHADALNNRCIALAQLGRTAEALASCGRAVQLKPSSADIHSNFGVVLARLGRYPEAIQHYEEALRLRPDFAQARQNLDDLKSYLEKKKKQGS